MHEVMVVTDESTFRQTAVEAPPGARVPVEIEVTTEDPFTAYRQARTDAGDGIYLATTGGQSGWGYFAIDPVERIQVSGSAVSIAQHSDNQGDIAEKDTTESQTQGPTLDELDSILSRESLVRGPCAIPYPCGAFGWLSYDIARELESIPQTTPPSDLPRVQIGVFDRVAAWEEPRSDGPVTMHITACPVVDADADIGNIYQRGLTRAHDLASQIDTGSASVDEPTVSVPDNEMTFKSECGTAAFEDRVRQIKEYVRDGDTFQTNVSHRLSAPAAIHPVTAFDALQEVNPAPYSALIEFPGVDLVSASPELLLSVNGNRVSTEPIAGTRPRGETSAHDDELETDLTENSKERAEHAMLVDLERNDLGKICEYGTVNVSEYRRVDRYSEVMHLVSLIEGQRQSQAGIADAVAAVFPGGTITGAPKPRTMELIDEVETTRRGPYTGSIGIFGFDDRAVLNIIIRTLVRRNDEYRLRVGAGIVHDSIPDQEYQETLDKARALVRAVDTALGEQGSLAVGTTGDSAGESAVRQSASIHSEGDGIESGDSV
ncbi:anthranilate synthase component I family protein [Haloquadratum walsbyi]|jgi:aminodeoxychorismate synthase, subunit I (EC 6.3.5.8)|uniref:anthranilate synthase n=1 Tax=Haloquadratum walsbyi J07HQW2 TaxID=1238425 RepID=U1NIU6_9EURY|nr:anthranilate synthase component I family protein [Haloquadratum walsbyi]ERG96843.1 MAG: anthranilate/para-aminobenzoate synthases component I [Haloquadratum walsbyi J07HQW2]